MQVGFATVDGMASGRISKLGIQTHTFGVNWVSNSFHPIAFIHKNMDILKGVQNQQ